MPRLDKRPSVHNLKVETYSTAPAMPSPFQKVFGSLQQSLGRYRATFDTVATPNPISSVSGCGSSQADLTKLNPSKNAAISLLAKAHIQKIKDENDLARAFHANVRLDIEELNDLEEACTPVTPSVEGFFNFDNKRSKLTQQSMDEAHIILANVRMCIEDQVHDLMADYPKDKLTTAFDLSDMKFEVMNNLVKSFEPVKKHRALFDLSLILVASAFEKNGIRVRPTNEAEQKYLRDFQYRVAAQIHTTDKKAVAQVRRIDSEHFIVGAGPGGLIAALKALDDDQTVTLVEKRDSFDRVSVVELNAYASKRVLEIAKVLQEETPDTMINKKPIAAIIETLDKYKHIKTKDLQALLLEAASEMDGFRYLPNVEIDSIDGNAQSAILVNENGSVAQLTFTHVLHADGVGSASNQMLVQDTHVEGFKTQGHFDEEKENAPATNYQYQGGMYMLQAGDKPFFAEGERPSHILRRKLESDSHTKAALRKLAAHGWTLKRLPVVYMYCDSNRKSVWVAGERPEKVNTQQELEQWFQTVALIDKPHAQLSKKEGAVSKEVIDETLSGIDTQLTIASKGQAKELTYHKKELEKVVQRIFKGQEAVRDPKVLEVLVASLKLLTLFEGKTGLSAERLQQHKKDLGRFERKLRKNTLNGAIFENNLYRFSPRDGVKTFGLNGMSFMIGDAVVNPHFHYGHGSSDALADAENAMKAIDMRSEKGEDAAVNFYRAKMDSRINKVTRFYNAPD